MLPQHYKRQRAFDKSSKAKLTSSTTSHTFTEFKASFSAREKEIINQKGGALLGLLLKPLLAPIVGSVLGGLLNPRHGRA